MAELWLFIIFHWDWCG